MLCLSYTAGHVPEAGYKNMKTRFEANDGATSTDLFRMLAVVGLNDIIQSTVPPLLRYHHVGIPSARVRTESESSFSSYGSQSITIPHATAAYLYSSSAAGAEITLTGTLCACAVGIWYSGYQLRYDRTVEEHIISLARWPPTRSRAP